MGSWSTSSSLEVGERRQSAGASSTSISVRTFLNQRRGSKSVRLSIISSTVASIVFQILGIERAAFGVALGELEAAESNLVEIVHERAPFLQAKLGLVGGFGGIADERALVEALRRGQRGLVAEQHFEKVQAPRHGAQAPRGIR